MSELLNGFSSGNEQSTTDTGEIGLSSTLVSGQDTITERLNSKPFEIRGHRLGSMFYNPKVIGENGLRWVSNRIKDANRERRFGVYNEVPDIYFGGTTRDYDIDILGASPTTFDISQRNKAEIAYVKNFLELPDNAPVLLTRRPDTICSLCVIGEHCTNRKNPHNPDSKYESQDEDGIKQFIAVTEWLGGKEGEDFTVKMKSTTKSPDIESVLTTKGMLVKMLLEWKRYQMAKAVEDETKFEQWCKEREYEFKKTDGGMYIL